MIIVGIDPGLAGAIVAVNTENSGYRVWDMPTLSLERGGKTKREVDEDAVCLLLAAIAPDHVFLEKVWSQRGEGVSSVFSFGMGFGILRGVIAGLGYPRTMVPAQIWKRTLGVPKAKDGSRQRASQLMPGAAQHWQRVMDHGRAEAALIAYYGAQTMFGPPARWGKRKRVQL